jgi:hypothetical protein
MLFYVGGTFTRYEEVRAVIDRLTALGHECAYDWTRSVNDFSVTGDMLASNQGGYVMMDHWPTEAQKEVDAVRRVGDALGFCVFLGEQASLGWPTEFGMAIAFGVPRIAIVNPFKTTVFAALSQVYIAASVDDAVDSIMNDILDEAIWAEQ